MGRPIKWGVCHLCGQTGRLSFEHVPPEAAFNDQRVLETDIERLLGSKDLIHDLQNPRGKFKQRGAGNYTLCEPCNNNTGEWYGKPYVHFVRALFPLCGAVPPDTTVTVECTIRPLDVLKQMLVMFCSASPPKFAQKHPKLVRYLLNRDSREVDDQRIFLSLYDWHNSIAIRQAGPTGRIDLGGGSHVFAEISFPPFNIVMTVDGSGAPDPRLFEVTWFKNYNYHETVPVRLKLTSLTVTSYFPADYRSIDELKARAAQADAELNENE